MDSICDFSIDNSTNLLLNETIEFILGALSDL